MTKKIGVFVGSLRKESFSRKTANALIRLAPASLQLEIIEIQDLSLFNQDQEENPPPSWREFKRRVRACEGVLFVTPEYNRSVPGVLKNAIDIASRPYGQNAWDGKPGAIVSISIGALGGFGANHHLRQSLVFLNVPVLQTPELYLGNASQLFDVQGGIKNSSTRDLLLKFLMAYAAWTETLNVFAPLQKTG